MMNSHTTSTKCQYRMTFCTGRWLSAVHRPRNAYTNSHSSRSTPTATWTPWNPTMVKKMEP
jgi:hypothetical protein